MKRFPEKVDHKDLPPAYQELSKYNVEIYQDQWLKVANTEGLTSKTSSVHSQKMSLERHSIEASSGLYQHLKKNWKKFKHDIENLLETTEVEKMSKMDQIAHQRIMGCIQGTIYNYRSPWRTGRQIWSTTTILKNDR